jgi:signal transduction histidine kinase
MVDIMESMDPKSRAYCFKVMKSSTKNGIDIIEMVRNLRAIDEGKAQLFLGPVNLHKAVHTSVDMLKVRFDQKKVSVVCDVAEKVFVHADQTSLINSVINNLLTNALKFSHADSEVLIRAYSPDQETICLSVKDSGIGMPKETIDAIFDLEKSASRKGTQDEKGTGFGMPLMKKFLDIYGATVEIRSKCIDTYPEGHGTEFVITFDKAESKQK